MTGLAEKIFEGQLAEGSMEIALEESGVIFGRLGFDNYDSSIELHEVPADFRLSDDQQRIFWNAGFSIVFMNHVDKWETHYCRSRRNQEGITPGWRVSYPHKRNDGDPSIWVEAVVESWPDEWFKNGKVKVVSQ